MTRSRCEKGWIAITVGTSLRAVAPEPGHPSKTRLVRSVMSVLDGVPASPERKRTKRFAWPRRRVTVRPSLRHARPRRQSEVSAGQGRVELARARQGDPWDVAEVAVCRTTSSAKRQEVSRPPRCDCRRPRARRECADARPYHGPPPMSPRELDPQVAFPPKCPAMHPAKRTRSIV